MPANSRTRPRSGYVMPLDLLRSVVATLPHPDGETIEQRQRQIQAAVTVITEIKPRDPVEEMLVGQAIATHAAIMECFRLAMREGATCDDAIRYRNDAVKLTRHMLSVVDTLYRRQTTETPAQEAPEPPAIAALVELPAPAVAELAPPEPPFRQNAPRPMTIEEKRAAFGEVGNGPFAGPRKPRFPGGNSSGGEVLHAPA